MILKSTTQSVLNEAPEWSVESIIAKKDTNR